MKKMLLIITICFTAVVVKAQTADSAMIYLTGSHRQYNPQRAFALHLQRAQGGEAKAMNAVAMQYCKGLGVDTSTALAKYWFLQAAQKGYTKAWVNLGMLYKRNSTDSLGYAQACSYFTQAVQVQEPSAFFAQGYMHYKGLGCTQDYALALQLFRQGNMLGRPECLYFTGLCYKFGYGITANADSAGWYIDKAAKMGYIQANIELAANGDTTTTTGNRAGRAARQASIPQVQAISLQPAAEAYRAIPVTHNALLPLDGTYTGWLVQYDHSGKYELYRKPLSLALAVKGNRLTGLWQQGTDSTVEVQAIQDGNRLVFATAQSGAAALIKGRHKQVLVFRQATLSLARSGDSTVLQGNLVLYNTYTRELARPVMIQLVRKAAPVADVAAQPLTIYPNPVAGNTFTVSFVQQQAVPVKVSVYNLHGQLLHSSLYNNLAAGQQTLTVKAPLATQGIYTVTVTAAGNRYSGALIKE
jgi:TPR repeat protein